MYKVFLFFKYACLAFIFLLLASCASYQTGQNAGPQQYSFATDYAARLPQHINTANNKLILVDPNAHAWGAYSANGNLIRAGIATAGGTVCPPDAEGESNCRTGVGTFRISSIGGVGCYSKKYPRPTGGGLMPYCMFFNNGQAMHGSPDHIVVEDNISHGCVRMRIPDAEWMTNSFAQVGTRIKVLPYNN